MEDKIVEEDIEMTDIMITIEAGNMSRERISTRNHNSSRDRSPSSSRSTDPGQAPELIQTEIG